MKLRIWAAVALLTASSISSAAGSAVVDGRFINNIIPQGYCAIGDAVRRDALTKTAQELSGAKGLVLSVFESCPGKQASAPSGRGSTYRYGWVVVGRVDGTTVASSESTRAQYLAVLDSVMRKDTPSISQDPDKRLLAARSSKVPVYEDWGAIGRDANAIYRGSLGTLETKGTRLTLGISVAALTFANNQTFVNFLYEIVNDNTSVAGLLAEQQKLTASFVKNNEPDKSRD
ncbi:hypothetical protein SAMN05518854_11723 [Variovorax sp. YR266]|uniref:hypothetical protein n=1 Tax=Variovorax sp. YR266 TaxID=1884386 RepID=UPI000897E6E4|nr:hypothetical protein [Variovorax sp. YR266]SDZ71229.1 hypothetical protein SAMN05518854_11723 [Variovorax sp. YR266]